MAVAVVVAMMATSSFTLRCVRTGLGRGSRCCCSSTAEGAKLIQWVEKGGGKVWPGLKVEKDGDGLGLVASQPVEAGQKLISLSSQLLLSLPDSSSHLSAADQALLLLAERVPEKLWTLKLGLKLLAERARKDSYWWPYISVLPQRFHVPVFFSGEDIASLQYAPLIHQVNKRCKLLVEFAKVDIPSVLGGIDEDSHPFGNQHVDSGALAWAMAAVSSRAFRVQQKQADGSRKLLPLVDMCNHSFRPNARIEQHGDGDDEDFSLQVVAEEDVDEGTPILLNYGSLSNDMLLLDYGFVLPNNPHDTIELRFDAVLLMLDQARAAAGVKQPKLASFTSPAPWQQVMLVQLQLQGSHRTAPVTTLGRSQADGRLLAALRVLFTDDAASLRNKSVEALQEWGLEPPLGIVNESNVLQTLAALCEILLGHFPTSVAEDLDLLKQQQVPPTRRLALLYRLNKKQLLLELINSCWSRLATLERGRSCIKPEEASPKISRERGFGSSSSNKK